MIAFAKANLRKYDTSKVCRVLNVSRSGYYKAIRGEKREDNEIEKQVIHCFQRHNGNYGRIRIRKELLRQGVDVSEYRISGILRRNGLEAKGGRSGRRRRPKPTAEQYIEENLIRDKFSVTEPNYLWCSWISTKLDKFQGRFKIAKISRKSKAIWKTLYFSDDWPKIFPTIGCILFRRLAVWHVKNCDAISKNRGIGEV